MIDDNVNLLSLFSGIGAFEKALKNIGEKYNLVNFCEIDKYAAASYCAVHDENKSKNMHDITKVNEELLPADIDLITYGFPCQDISVSGLKKGFYDENNKKTRSGLCFDALRIIEEVRPRVAIAENVKNLTSKKFNKQFNTILKGLEEAGYNNYWKVLNSKDFGIPQNRERVFIISVRKDIDTRTFKFPEGFPLVQKMSDLLENHVAEKYFLKNIKFTRTNNFKNRLACECDTACVQVGNINIKGIESIKRVYSPHGISPTLTSMQGGNRQPKILEDGEKIRKLTPLECWRLMGFDDYDFFRAKLVCSDTQLYKQAGNSIVVNILSEIFKELNRAKIL